MKISRFITLLTLVVVALVTSRGNAVAEVNSHDFPQTAQVAARIFGIPGQRSANPSQWEASEQSDGRISAWHLLPGELNWVYAPPGANIQGWDGATELTVTEGPWLQRPLLEATIRQSAPIPVNPPLTNWPQSPAEAAAKFGVPGSPSANAANWSRPATEPTAWVFHHNGWSPISIPAGAKIEGWGYLDREHGQSVQAQGPWQDFVSDATVRANFQVFLPYTGRGKTPRR